MSTLNANVNISVDHLTLNSNATFSVGNSTSNLSISTNGNSSMNVGSVFMNSTVILVGNGTSNTLMNSTSISTSSFTINSSTVNSTTIASMQFTNVQIFTSNSTWTKPSWVTNDDIVTVTLWGGGGGGVGYFGGGGGACVKVDMPASRCNSVCNVVIGRGGATGVAGENSIFYPNTTVSIIAYGGGPASSTLSGGGGGWFSAGTVYNPGEPFAYNSGSGYQAYQVIFGGGWGVNTTTAISADAANGLFAASRGSVWGGGGGGGGNNATAAVNRAGGSVWGGGGGAGGHNFTPSLCIDRQGTSIYGGDGANSSSMAQAPGGGGCAVVIGNTSISNVTSGVYNYNGARGEVRVVVTKMRRY